MAQTGFTPIQLYSTSTAAAAPAAGNLTNSTLGSELAINITDGKLFYKDNANAVQVIAWKTTPTTAGGTGLTTYTAGDLSYYASGTTFTKLAIGTTGQVLTSTGSAPQWSTLSGVAVTTFSAGTTGFTPNSATSGAITLAGTLVVSNGGTGLTSLTTGYIPFGNATSAFGSDAGLYWDNTNKRLAVGSTTTPLTTIEGYATANSLQIISSVRNNQAGSGVAAIGFNVASSAAGDTSACKAGIGLERGAAQGVGSLCFYNRSSTDTASFTTADEAMRIFASKGVSIGNTTDPGATNLSVTGSASAASFIPTGSTVPTNGLYLPAANSLSLATNTTERLRVDSAGFIGIGTSTPLYKLHVYDATLARIAVVGDANTLYLGQRYSTDAGACNINLAKARGSFASPTAVATGDAAGGLVFQAYGGSNFRNVATIVGNIETYTSDTSIAGNITFSTNNGTSNVEKMRITGAGNIYPTSGTTGMTDGFFYIPSAAGAPSGVPTAISGRVPMYYDSTNDFFYIYNGAWKKILLA
jgi:hypothetical protein